MRIREFDLAAKWRRNPENSNYARVYHIAHPGCPRFSGFRPSRGGGGFYKFEVSGFSDSRVVRY